MSQNEIVKKMWCTACCAAVDTFVKQEAAVVGPLLLGSLGLVHASSRRKASALDVILTTVFTASLGAVIENVAAPKLQQLVCKNCQCSHLAELAA